MTATIIFDNTLLQKLKYS